MTLTAPRAGWSQDPVPSPAPYQRPATIGAVEEAPARVRLRVPAIDGFRAYAAIAVVLIHVYYYAGRPILDEGLIRSVIVAGYMGVDFFFVISGFVLFLPAATNNGRVGSIRSYAERRAARILPAYLLMLVGIILLHPLIANAAELPQNSIRGAISLLLHLTFLEHSVGTWLGFPLGFAANPVVWTLTIEALFYLILPFVAWAFYRRPLVGLVVAVGVAVLWKIVATSEAFLFVLNGRTYDMRITGVQQLPTYAIHFAMGMAAAWLFVRLQGEARRIAGWVAIPAQVASVIVVILAMRSAGIRDLGRPGHPYTDGAGNWYFETWTQTAHVGVAFAVLILATALAPRWAQWPATNPVARFVGNASYGIYLWHFPIMGFAIVTLGFMPDGSSIAFARLLAVTFFGSLLLGWLSYVVLERPLIRWAARRSAEREHRRIAWATPAEANFAPSH